MSGQSSHRPGETLEEDSRQLAVNASPVVESVDTLFRKRFGPELDDAVGRIVVKIELRGRGFYLRFRRQVSIRHTLMFLTGLGVLLHKIVEVLTH